MAVLTFNFSAESAAEVQTVTLDGEVFRLRLRWSEVQAAWYMDLYTADEQPVQLGRRLSPGYAPVLGRRGPKGLFVVDGPDPYQQSDLGNALLLLYVEANP